MVKFQPVDAPALAHRPKVLGVALDRSLGNLGLNLSRSIMKYKLNIKTLNFIIVIIWSIVKLFFI